MQFRRFPVCEFAISFLKDICQRADSHSIHWTLGIFAPALRLFPAGVNVPVFNHFRSRPHVASGLPSPGPEERKSTGGNHMRKLLTHLSCILFAVAPLLANVASASGQTKDDDR